MKKLFYFFLVLCFSLAAVAQNRTVTVRLGSSGAAASGSGVFFNVKSYGAKGDNVADETAAVQAATDAAKAAGGGTVYWPAGQYKVGKITTYNTVRQLGDGILATQVFATTDTVFKLDGSAYFGVTGWWDKATTQVEEMYIQGTTAATAVGISINKAANFRLRRVFLYGFTNGSAVTIANALVGTLEEIYTHTTQYGVKAYSNTSYGTNHIRLDACNIQYASKLGVDWSGGGNLVMDHCDLEQNGTAGDTLSGGVYFHGNIWSKGVVLKNCWFEQNKGGFEVSINGSSPTIGPSYAAHEIIACNLQGRSDNTIKRNIYISGSNQRLSIFGSTIFGALSFNNIVVDGTNNTVKSWGTTFDNSTANIVRGSGNSITNN